MTRLPWTFVLGLAAAVTATAAVGCGSSYPKRLEYGAYESRAMHGVQMEYSIYTPPGFDPEREELPLVLFLHGGGDSPESFDQHAIGARLDAAVERGDIPRVVVVLPEGDLGMWANWRDGTRNYEDWVLYELLPHVRASYNTQDCPEGCHVMGVSMGGSGTMRFALHHPELFASAAIISAPVMDTDAMMDFSDDRLINMIVPTHRIWGEPQRETVRQDDPFYRWTGPEAVDHRVYVAWAAGDRKTIVFGSQKLHEHFEDTGVPHGWEEFEGGHNWVSWGPVIERAIAYGVAGDEEVDDEAREAYAGE